MSTDVIRVGKVSSYDSETGTASIYYPDRGTNATVPFPVLSPFGIRQELKKEDTVLVVHLSDGAETGVIIGKYTSFGNLTSSVISVGDDGVLQIKNGESSVRLSDNGAEIKASGGVMLSDDDSEMTLDDVETALEDVKVLEERVNALGIAIGQIGSISDDFINGLGE